MKVAVSYHLVARTQSCMGDFRAALQNEKETYTIYKQQVSERQIYQMMRILILGKRARKQNFSLNILSSVLLFFGQKLGEEHEKTKESSECLRHLTQQAVILQKKMNEIYNGRVGTSLPPIHIQPPSMGSVLDMLNIINGILFVQIRYKVDGVGVDDVLVPSLDELLSLQANKTSTTSASSSSVLRRVCLVNPT